MPHRSIALLLGVAGILVLAWLVVRRVDLQRAARVGPLWRRRMVSAALALLALLGVTPRASAEPERKAGGPPPKASSQSDLARTAEWRKIQATWQQAEAVSSGKRGEYPFDTAGKKRLLAALDDAAKQIDALVRNGRLHAAAAGLLKQELNALVEGVEAKRPTEMRLATCYEPMPVPQPTVEAMKRIELRLPLLEKLARAGRVQPEVLAKVLATIEHDVQVLGDEKMRAQLIQQKDRVRAEELSRRGREAAAKLRASTPR